MDYTTKIQIPNELASKSWHFAQNVVETTKDYLAKRGQTNLDKIKRDYLSGVLGEWGVQQFLDQHAIHCTEPDTRIFRKGKSYAPDLQASDYGGIHVKSYTPNQFTPSWVFTFGQDRTNQDPLLIPGQHNHHQWIAFTEVTRDEEKQFHVEVIGIVSANIAYALDLYQYPDKKELIPYKRVIKREEVEKLERWMRWGFMWEPLNTPIQKGDVTKEQWNELFKSLQWDRMPEDE